ncbi:MAG: hypothetical protein LBI33_10470 [Propionibacteriaceae bacterium]|jgi:hypothetical protein|nr:hypothetical protein [Propionibacteriaceae bacterium]
MSDLDPQAAKQIQAAPLPTPGTLKHRRNVAYQFVRFAALNLKMIRVIGASH